MPIYAIARMVVQDLLIDAPDFESARRLAGGEDVPGCSIPFSSIVEPTDIKDVLEVTEEDSLEIAECILIEIGERENEDTEPERGPAKDLTGCDV